MKRHLGGGSYLSLHSPCVVVVVVVVVVAIEKRLSVVCVSEL